MRELIFGGAARIFGGAVAHHLTVDDLRAALFTVGRCAVIAAKVVFGVAVGLWLLAAAITEPIIRG